MSASPAPLVPQPAPGGPRRFPSDFAAAPFIVIWEATRACALACVHCRADAIPRRDPNELTTVEACGLIDQVKAFGEPSPLFVLTGGDPMWRKDLVEIVGYATAQGVSVALTPSGTGAPTKARLAELQQAGLSRVAVSLDGPDAATHDLFRGVRGSYMYTMKIIDAVAELGLPLQINTTVSRTTLPRLRAMAARVAEFPLTLWAVFFLIQTGRGRDLDQISSAECEDVLVWLDELSSRVPFGIKTTEAPHYRRVIWQAEQARAAAGTPQAAGVFRRPQLRATRAVNDGNGFVFIDHVGAIYPSGFLPMPCGSVRTAQLADVYRDHPVFTHLRNADGFGGRCGRCEFRELCGGSRSRAYAATGNALGEDPLCSYEPKTNLVIS
ncbi:MAG: TIGR04053 family radical SAM/SPASM domain-containing protein [Vicinamibacterales bacterium]|nr:TIGR04053 family radical SAM/SPASM domain-containing protein [Vicinamibacterales bacterium]